MSREPCAGGARVPDAPGRASAGDQGAPALRPRPPGHMVIGGMISDGLGLTPTGGGGAPPPALGTLKALVTLFGGLRVALSLVLAVGAVGTFGMRPSGRRASLAYAVGWIVVGGVEPFALRYRFGWPVVASAAYPFLLLMLFNGAAWKAAFAPAEARAAPPTAR
ncbi:MAG: hypothetical protein E6K81_04785 [Candidatus Eisenbacteria bacterium]|uniref:Uncharacterized protein n=1 Tax=Eiseniibacteriota bacterium TaxID=2212470 RepID=A0A538UC08_UNCEI|nr:MAG: hypothetical protein E6K81_04785 [Candidatus Eisenbacteria bacterium]